MGRMIYENSVRLDVDDRTLAHLVVVISSKLRRGESFHFTWRNDPSVGDGRTTIWVHPRASLVFEFSGSRRPSLNPAWLDALSFVANSPEGLHLIPEPPSATSTEPVSAPTTEPTPVQASQPAPSVSADAAQDSL